VLWNADLTRSSAKSVSVQGSSTVNLDDKGDRLRETRFWCRRGRWR